MPIGILMDCDELGQPEEFICLMLIFAVANDEEATLLEEILTFCSSGMLRIPHIDRNN